MKNKSLVLTTLFCLSSFASNCKVSINIDYVDAKANGSPYKQFRLAKKLIENKGYKVIDEDENPNRSIQFLANKIDNYAEINVKMSHNIKGTQYYIGSAQIESETLISNNMTNHWCRIIESSLKKLKECKSLQ